MPWNWELRDWPQFHYKPERIASLEKKFLLDVGSAIASLKTIEETDYQHLVVEILSQEGWESSKIEGEILDREGLQSSIRQHFGLPGVRKRRSDGEAGMAELLCNLYETFERPLTHKMLWRWHAMLFKHATHIDDVGKYRTHLEPMQIVSNRYGDNAIYFEAIPSRRVPQEMSRFIAWFNASRASGSLLARAAIAHLYFESIHPFEDGNGRIGRALVEKCLSQEIGRPVLMAISKTLNRRKKDYYAALEKCNRTLEVQEWVEFFAKVTVRAHEEAMQLITFLIEKSRMLYPRKLKTWELDKEAPRFFCPARGTVFENTARVQDEKSVGKPTQSKTKFSVFLGINRLAEQINPRQLKVLLRMFAEGPSGFKGGLSAENYIAIAKTTRATATRDLADLVKKGALVKTGRLRHTRYQLNLG